MLDVAAIKPHLKSLAATGAPLYILGDGQLVAQTPNFTVRVTDEALKVDRCVLSSARFSSFISKAKGVFSVQKMDGGVRLLSGSLSVDFPGADLTAADVQPAYTTSIPTNTLKELLAYASAVTDAKATMTYAGVVHLQAEGDLFDEDVASSVRASATDGYRALQASTPCSLAPLDLFIPATLVGAVINFAGETTEVADTENYLAFRSGGVEAWATKFAVTLPDIGSLFSARPKIKMSFAAEDAKIILGNLNPFLDTKDPDVVCSFEQNIVVTTGTARDELKYTSTTLPNQKFKTPSRFLTDFLSRATGVVQLETDDFSRMLFTNHNKKYVLAAKNG